MIVILIGYRGSGKSSVGRLLAAALRIPFADADAEIERRAGKTIKQIFDDDGEGRFRDLEEETIRDLLERESLVLAAGGGAIMRERTRERIEAAGTTVWLHASAETLAERISGDTTTVARRPNLTAAGGLEEIRALAAEREPVYRAAADVTIDTEGRDPKSIAAEIAAALAPGASS
jgi:shikimate kinase